MDGTVYAALARQTGLQAEMDVIANNVANASTTGFRRGGIVFSEFVKATGAETDSLSLVRPGAFHIARDAGAMEQTGGAFDFAIDGEGFFQIDVGGAVHLTRAGRFAPDANGALATPDGNALLDASGAPVVIPPGVGSVVLGSDGTLSADGAPLAQLGVVRPVDPTDFQRAGSQLFRVEGALEPVGESRMQQGFLEGSNVNPVEEIARLIEVQRRYEAARAFLDRENDRVGQVIRTLGQN